MGQHRETAGDDHGVFDRDAQLGVLRIGTVTGIYLICQQNISQDQLEISLFRGTQINQGIE